MIARRTILKAIGMAMAAPATAPASMSVGAAAASLGVAVNGLNEPTGTNEGIGESIYPYEIIDAMFSRREQSRTPIEHMPHHIRDKKSWSPAFKHHVHMREEAIMQAVRRRMQNDEDFRTKVGTMLGLEGWVVND